MSPLSPAPAWGLQLGSAGTAALQCGVLAFLLSAFAWLFPLFRKLGAWLFWAGTAFVIVAMGFHIAILMERQYEFKYVFEHTRDDMPWIYRLSAAWAGQQGSFLLWVTTSAIIAALAAPATGAYRRWFSVVCGLALAAMLGMVVFDSPFELIRIPPELAISLPPGQTTIMPTNPVGLNPTLQNYWMVIHPWVIFTGFGSLLALFGWSVSAAFSKDWQSWATAARPWAVFSATVLGVGLTMGGLWAYETLGWGGFWAWDPVENVSLVPFIAASVLIHTLYVQANRARWARWNLFLGAMPFVWFAYGTYLTRSGALKEVSVHSFAEMAKGAHNLLLFLVLAAVAVVLTVVAIALFVKRRPDEPAPSGDRSLGMAWGMGALYLIGVFAAIGMSLPFLAAVFHFALPKMMDASGKTVSESLYNRVVLWPFVPALLLMGVAPLLGWTKTLAPAWNRIVWILYATFFLSAFPMVLIMRRLDTSRMVMFAVILCVWACLASVVSNIGRLVQRRKNPSALGAFLTHTGVAILLLGLIVSHAFERTGTAAVTSHDDGKLDAGPLHYTVAMRHAPNGDELLTPENALDLQLTDPSGRSTEMKPTVYYNAPNNDMADIQLVMRPSIRRSALYDTYLSVTSRETSFADDIDLEPGQSRQVPLGENMSHLLTITYVKKTVTGTMGMPGATWKVDLQLDIMGQRGVITPEMKMTESGITHTDVLVMGRFGVRLERLRAGTGVATISILRPEPTYALQLFFKPLTILVWLGAGLMTLGGAVTVWRLSRSRNAGQTE